jgi:hypothetical protein
MLISAVLTVFVIMAVAVVVGAWYDSNKVSPMRWWEHLGMFVMLMAIIIVGSILILLSYVASV